MNPGMRRRLLSGNWYGPTKPEASRSSGSSPSCRAVRRVRRADLRAARRRGTSRLQTRSQPSTAQDDAGHASRSRAAVSAKSLRQRSGVGDRRHEVGVARPPRHDVDVQVLTDRTAGWLAQVDADVDPFRCVRPLDRDDGIRHRGPQLRRFVGLEILEIGDLPIRKHEHVTGRVRKGVEDHEARRCPDERCWSERRRGQRRGSV